MRCNRGHDVLRKELTTFSGVRSSRLACRVMLFYLHVAHGSGPWEKMYDIKYTTSAMLISPLQSASPAANGDGAGPWEKIYAMRYTASAMLIVPSPSVSPHFVADTASTNGDNESVTPHIMLAIVSREEVMSNQLGSWK